MDARTLRVSLSAALSASADLAQLRCDALSLGTLMGTPNAPFAVPSPRCVPPPAQGYPLTGSTGSVVERQHACLRDLTKLQAAFETMRAGYAGWRQANPEAREPSDGTMTLGEALEAHMPVHERCVRIVCVLVHERPEVLDEARALASAAGTETNQGADASNPGGNLFSILGKTFAPLLQAIAPVAQLLGGVLSSPLGVPLLTAACTAIPGAQVLLPFIPVIAPIAGAVLSGAGGVVAGSGGSGGVGGVGGVGIDLSSVLSGITGLLGGVGDVAGGDVGPRLLSA